MGKKSKSGSETKIEGENNENPTVGKENQEPTKQARAPTSSSSSHKGGFVLIDKKYEPLEAAIQAYESRFEAQIDLPDKLKQYPNAREEKARLAVNRQRIQETQTMIDGYPKGR